MIEKFTLARPYAKGAFTVAKARGDMNEWMDLMQYAAALVAEKRIAFILNHPEITQEKKINLFIELCKDKLDAYREKFLRLLGDYKRLRILPEISELFMQYVKKDEKHTNIKVITAFAIDDAQTKKIEASLAQRLQHDVSLDIEVDPKLIGGMLIKAGDLVIDGSVRSQLAKLQQELLA
ncbi:MAG: F0F1 ATP synthase subunit delta [Pseudomonadota bacterium]